MDKSEKLTGTPLPAAAIDAAKPVIALAADTQKDAPETGVTQKTVDPENLPRTPGLKLFDVFLYPFLTNFVVMGISIAATYLTARGGDVNAEGKLIYGKVGKWFGDRGESTSKWFKKRGMSDGQADMAKMVFWSFADGTAVAPMVKLLEDRREKIAHWIDRKLGTKPEDEAVYAAEPKQSWFSVIAGRFAVASIVVPTAVALDKTGLNDVLFSNPGREWGEAIARKPNIAKFFGKLHIHDIPELGKIGLFEAFYTSVCTYGLYVSSRFLARLTVKRAPPVTIDIPAEPAQTSPAPDDSAPTKKHAGEKAAKPVLPTTLLERAEHHEGWAAMGLH